jgi:hypothetical protein
MSHHALEITLTRPVTDAELTRASGNMPLATSHDGTRLMALSEARDAEQALHRLHNQMQDLLPIDVMTTHYPAADGSVLLSIAFTDEQDTGIRRVAEHAGQTLSTYVENAIRHHLRRHAQQEAAHLDYLLQTLLKRATAPQLLAAVGRALTRISE